MDRGGEAATPEQISVLRSALENYGGELGPDLSRQEVIEYALEDASTILTPLDRDWRRLQKTEARRRSFRRSPIGRLRAAVEAAPTLPGYGMTISVVGLVLVLIAVSHFTSNPSDDRALGIRLLVSGLVCYFGVRVAARLSLRRREEWTSDHFRGGFITTSAVGMIGSALLFAGLILLVAPHAFIYSAAFKVLALSLFAGGAFLSSLPALLPSDRLAIERLDSEREGFEHALLGAALRTLRQRLNIEDERAFSTELDYTDLSGLAEIDDPEREVPTKAKLDLLERMKLMPGGTVGIAGTRGAGKTTLMRSICAADSTRRKDDPPLAVVVDAPVLYDARDFVLYLFARVCAEVIGRDKVREMRGSDRPFGFPPTTAWALLADNRALLGLACLVAGAGLMFLSLRDETNWLSSPFAWAVVLSLIGYAMLATQTLRNWQRRNRLDGAGVGDEDRNTQTATLRLRQMWFQQSFSSGWSGGFKAPIGAEAGVTGSTELAEQQLSLPDIVDLFREFLGQIAVRREVRIGVDEMDKMDEDTARRFLNEIKVIFKVPDCFFFISISEDAMSVFERRGLPIRDVFDSSFDDVQHVPHLQFAKARELLERRTVKLPIPFLALLHCVAGGLPRDLVRAARALVELEKGARLDDAAAHLLGRSFAAKVEGAKIVARGFELEEHTTLFVGWLDRLLADGLTVDSLEGHCADFRFDVLARVAGLPDEEEPSLRIERREMQALATQLIAFAYYVATMLRFFGGFESRGAVEAATEGETDGSPAAPVDRLATVAQAFAVDINSAWKMLSDFRSDLDLGVEIEFPSLPLPERPSERETSVS